MRLLSQITNLVMKNWQWLLLIIYTSLPPPPPRPPSPKPPTSPLLIKHAWAGWGCRLRPASFHLQMILIVKLCYSFFLPIFSYNANKNVQKLLLTIHAPGHPSTPPSFFEASNSCCISFCKDAAALTLISGIFPLCPLCTFRVLSPPRLRLPPLVMANATKAANQRDQGAQNTSCDKQTPKPERESLVNKNQQLIQLTMFNWCQWKCTNKVREACKTNFR